MTRLEALEAVAAAADDMAREGARMSPALYNSLKALRALPAEPQPQGGTVTLAVWCGPKGRVLHRLAGSQEDASIPVTWTRLGTVTLPLNRERGE